MLNIIDCLKELIGKHDELFDSGYIEQIEKAQKQMCEDCKK